MNKLKELFYNNLTLIFLLVSLGVILCAKNHKVIKYIAPIINHNVYVKEEVKLELSASKLAKIEDKAITLLNNLDDVEYVHTYHNSNNYYYDFVLEDISDKDFDSIESDLKSYLNSVCSKVQAVWVDQNIKNVNVIVSILNYDDQEQVLLTSENAKITFSILTAPEKKGTEQDWLDWFIYEKGREPESNKELNEFRTKKVNSVYYRNL